MELQEIEPRNMTDKIVESMSEAEAEGGSESISENVTDSIYENPYSTHIYHDFGGAIIPPRNFNDDQSTDETSFQKIEKRKWYLLYLVLGLLTGVIVTGLSMHLTIIEELKMDQFKQEVLQKKYESVCPSWSEWSSCSQTCWGIKTRTDKCSNSDEQIKGCNQFSSCPRSGK